MPSKSSGLIYDSTKPNTESLVYQTSYSENDWTGHLRAFHVLPDGSAGAQLWDAADLLPNWAGRKIVTWISEQGRAVNFYWSELSDAQKTALSSESMVAYLRGSDALEVGHTDGYFRRRASNLGDIVNSLPFLVKNASFAYDLLTTENGGGTLYQAYLSAKQTRNPNGMLYVGANDGMLHAFDAKTGIEKWAYIPQAVYPFLKSLSDVSYVAPKHHYFVDGQMSEGDAYLLTASGTARAWKSILLGSTGAGAKSVFAIDISAPAEFEAKSVLWEHADIANDGVPDDDMGYVLGKASVVLLRNGQWAALYGNGVESNHQNAVLYLLDVATGTLIKKISAAEHRDDARNGLATPALRFNQQREVIAAYAGDLRGALWKFDLANSKPDTWQLAYNGVPFFNATDKSGQTQPITQQPAMTAHAKGGRMILFGTGKLYETSDQTDKQIQSVYGLWEKPSDTTTGMVISGRDQLQQQTLTAVSNGRLITQNAIDWKNQRGWYVDLLDKGERVVGAPFIVDDKLVVLTFTPGIAGAPASSQLMVFDLKTGGASAQAIFPNAPANQISLTVPASLTAPVVITLPNGRRSLVLQTLEGKTKFVDITTAKRKPLRTWHELQVQRPTQ
ncbi:pilus assembly protein [Glaciimonas soli]|nr:PilC/PilY family type IV pilus protein [Glaciimonas soli]